MSRRRQSRREFLGASSAAMALAALGARAEKVLAQGVPRDRVGRSFAPGDNAAARAVALAAVDAARGAGASYADVRVDVETSQAVSVWRHHASGSVYGDRFVYGVRVIANGQWGFAGDETPTVDAAAQCARQAVAQANANAALRRTPVVLAPEPTVSDASWATRIAVDPFSVPVGEQQELLLEAVRAALGVRGVGSAGGTLAFTRIDRTFASSEGSLIVQTIWRASPSVSVYATAASDANVSVSLPVRTLTGAAAGYELVRDAGLVVAMGEAAREAVRVAELVARSRPVEVGRYDVVMSGRAMADLVVGTLGRATGMERVIGKRASYEGTSFAAPPDQALGRPIASALVHLTADRTVPGGLATVGWDDEGVAAQRFALIERGVLVDYVTTRESAPALTWWYDQRHQGTRSHGCASGGGLTTPAEEMPNLELAPSSATGGVAQLIAGVERGIFFADGSAGTDDTVGTGTWWASPGDVHEIRHGKIVGIVRDAAMPFRTRDLWMALDALGGKGSVESIPIGGVTVRAPPGRFRGMAIVNAGTVL